MDKFCHLSPNDILNRTFLCSCGRTHRVPISKIEYDKRLYSNLSTVLNRVQVGGSILMVADNNTYSVAGEAIRNHLLEEGFHIEVSCFQREKPLVPDEKAIGEIITAIDDDTCFILAVGSGVINDISRYCSQRTKIPYGIVATAPSMDGYASTVSPLIIKGKKTSVIAGYPKFILSEPDLLCDAPPIMIQAGFGDVLGKITAMADWELSEILYGEHRCVECVNLVKRSVEAVIESAKGLSKGNRDSTVKLMDALVLSGLAMGLYGNSRPASGAEHHLSHFWEMVAIDKGEAHALHGNMVGVACFVSALIYDKVQKHLPKGFIIPQASKIQSLLNMMKMPTSPVDLGITYDTFHTGIHKALYIRERYTVLRFLEEKGLLDEMADYLSSYFYDKKTNG